MLKFNSIYLILSMFSLFIVMINCQTYNCNKLNCSKYNTKCKIFGCSPMFGCFETSKCPQQNVDACHVNSCEESTGQCISTSITCNDNNPNTNDWCHNYYGCQFDLIVTPPPCELTCNDNNPCTVDFCDFRNDCYHSNNTCTDFDACTNDLCEITSGCQNPPVICDDNNPCTADFCHRVYGCYHEPIECSIKVPCNVNSDCNRNNSCEIFTCDLTLNTCDYKAKDCGGNPCINNKCTNGSITN